MIDSCCVARIVDLLDVALSAGVPADCIEIRWVWPFRWEMTLTKKGDAGKKQQ